MFCGGCGARRGSKPIESTRQQIAPTNEASAAMPKREVCNAIRQRLDMHVECVLVGDLYKQGFQAGIAQARREVDAVEMESRQ